MTTGCDEVGLHTREWAFGVDERVVVNVNGRKQAITPTTRLGLERGVTRGSMSVIAIYRQQCSIGLLGSTGLANLTAVRRGKEMRTKLTTRTEASAKIGCP